MMRLGVTIAIPHEATIDDVNSVVEFLEGLGQVDLCDVRAHKIQASFEPGDQPVMDISAAIVDHTRQAVERALHDTSAGERARSGITLAISAGLGLLDRWDEILTELLSRGWDRPKWEIRA